jgi:hypothetical protein
VKDRRSFIAPLVLRTDETGEECAVGITVVSADPQEAAEATLKGIGSPWVRECRLDVQCR